MSGYAAGPGEPADAPPDPGGKRALRARVRAARRDRVPLRDRAADGQALAAAAVAEVDRLGLAPGDWVAAYESTPTEPPTEALVGALARRGLRVMVPLTLPDLDLDWVEAGTSTPLGREAVARCRVVFLPALSVDTGGWRLGQGGGCYDRAMPRAPEAWRVAVVHPWEVVEDALPREPHDRPVDAVLTAGEPVRALPATG
jgi:5-formyltetrahydrofolate cyclo-ligase